MKDAPKDRPILGWCIHEADAYHDEGKLTLYAAHVEGMSHGEDGPNVLVWGGSYDDSSYENPTGGYLPDWWHLKGSEDEVAAYPVAWMPIEDFIPEIDK
jgi:hypothetical protein